MGTVLLMVVWPDTTDSLVNDSLPSTEEQTRHVSADLNSQTVKQKSMCRNLLNKQARNQVVVFLSIWSNYNLNILVFSVSHLSSCSVCGAQRGVRPGEEDTMRGRGAAVDGQYFRS